MLHKFGVQEEIIRKKENEKTWRKRLASDATRLPPKSLVTV
jgi:hypothetical protein